MHNVETLAHLALIARYGAWWFRAVGTPAEPGSMLLTILGAVNQPCVCEIAIGTSLQETLRLAGGAAAPLQALLLGGYYGNWVDTAAAQTLPFSSEGLAVLGAGAGARPDRGTARTPADSPRPPGWCAISRTSPRASADHASSALTQSPANFSGSPTSRTSDLSVLRRWLGQVDGRGACSHPDGAAGLVRSALDVFKPELGQHAQGWCRATRTANVLPVPPRRQS